MVLKTKSPNCLSLPFYRKKQLVYTFQVTVTSDATAAVKDIVLEGPEHYHIWFANIKGSVPEDLWKYFDPEATDEFNEPETITVATLQEGATGLQQLSAVDRTLYAQLRAVCYILGR
jgi:hypothetical protein